MASAKRPIGTTDPEKRVCAKVFALARMHRAFEEIRAAHLAHPLPTLEEVAHTLRTDGFVTKLLQGMTAEADSWDRDRRPFSIWFGKKCAADASPINAYYLNAVAVFRRLGYGVTLHIDSKNFEVYDVQLDSPGKQVEFPMSVYTGRKLQLATDFNMQFWVPFACTSPGHLGRRGVLWCLPRLLAWARRAKIRAFDPARPDVKARLASECATLMAGRQ